MTQAKIKVTLSEGSSVLKNWEQTYETALPDLINAVKSVKQSVNDYLTQAVDQGKNISVKDQLDSSSEEEVEADVISGFIKNIGTGSGNSKRSKKQKKNYSKFGKKQKR